jgi:hypothetical protein
MQHARATDQSHELSMLVRRRCSRLARNLRNRLLISARGVGLQKNDTTQQKHLCPVALQKLPVKKPRETRRVCEEPEASYAWLMLIAINDDSHLITCKRHFTLGATSSPTFLQRQPLSIIRDQYYCCCVTHSILPMCSFRYNHPTLLQKNRLALVNIGRGGIAKRESKNRPDDFQNESRSR